MGLKPGLGGYDEARRFLGGGSGRWLRRRGQPYADFDRLAESSSYLFLSIHNN